MREMVMIQYHSGDVWTDWHSVPLTLTDYPWPVRVRLFIRRLSTNLRRCGR